MFFVLVVQIPDDESGFDALMAALSSFRPNLEQRIQQLNDCVFAKIADIELEGMWSLKHELELNGFITFKAQHVK